MTIGERIKHARKLRDMSRPDLAKASGMPYATLAGLENSDQSSSTQLHLLAKPLKVRQEWLATGKPPMESSDLPDESDWTNIRGYAQAVGLGTGVEAEEYEETHKLKFRADSLARKRLSPSKLAVIYGKGDSMFPRIKTGDAILFDSGDTRPIDGACYVIALEGSANTEYNVKRCEIVDDMVFFRADNPNGDHDWKKPRNMDNKRRPIKIIGRVRWIGSWED